MTQSAVHEPFHFHTVEGLRQQIRQLQLDLELSEDISPLLEPLQVGRFTLPNRLVVLPMEGCDGTSDGEPDELTFRRYHRFAAGGAGVLWFEATAVVREGRANPRQLWLHEKTVPAFRTLVAQTHRAAREANGSTQRPLLILQLTHSGRYSRPGRTSEPIIAHHSPYLDPTHHLPPDYPLISDDALERLEDAYVTAAGCALRAGFDGVDIKACHRYLISELHASFTRENSRYGGASFENRARFFRNVVRKIREAVPDLLVTSRLNAYDAMAYPYGFGVDRQHPEQPDLSEPLELVRFLREHGAPLVNITIGNPYYNPHVNRPFDLPTLGAPMPAEHPLTGVHRFVQIVRQVQTTFPGLAVIGGGYSWLRQFFPYLAAANVRAGWVSLVGLGRMAFAYPDCLRDLQRLGRLQPDKVCVACSACTQIMRDGGRSGCVPRDATVYEPIYKTGRAEALDTIVQLAKSCRQCNDPTCVGGCPAQVNIPQFIGHLAERRFREAYEVLREANVLATVCGYVCPSEVQCEAQCLNQHYTEPVRIRHLQRWVSRKALEEGWAAELRQSKADSGRRVAVIGTGPAGVAAATRLASRGHAVTVFDGAAMSGGMAHQAIPAERLPEAIMQKEIQDVLVSSGQRIQRRQATLNATFTLDNLLAEGFDAALLATGLGQSVPLQCPTRPLSGVMGALEFLVRAKLGSRITGNVLVLGGGNTAVDAAVSAKQAGAEDVAIVYRRSFADMPAWPAERDKAIRTGIHFLTLTAPLDYVTDAAGGLRGLKVVRTRLAEVDASGRRRPESLTGTEHVLLADLVLEAIGQQMTDELRQALPHVRLTEDGCIWVRHGQFQTSRYGVFAAGDIVNGGTTVVRAVAEGVRAAEQMDLFLRRVRLGTPTFLLDGH